MREEAIWVVLHKAWEASSQTNRLLGQLQTQTTGQQLWEMTEAELQQHFPQVPASLWEQFSARKKQTDLSKVEAYLQQNQIQILLSASPSYPPLLKEIHQPPALLYCRGNLAPASLRIAIVGSRKGDSYGLSAARQLGSELSRSGVCVVSGLARGIDSKAHQGALEGPAGTIAVQGCGIDQIYPKENRKLAEQILDHEKGCILSEFPLGSLPLAWHFPLRNRIISGLCQGVVIVQAAIKSGAFITVETALEQGRDVFAVPGQIQNPLSAGPHRFLQEGARLVTCGADILAEYGQEYEQQCLFAQQVTGQNRKEASAKASMTLTEKEKHILQYCTAEPITVEEIAYLSRMSIAELMPILSMLELHGLVKQMIGRKYIRVG